MCSNEIPADKKWDAICCGPDCTKARKQYGRSRLDQTRCRYCLKPSTPEERIRFKLWQQAETDMMTPELAAKVREKWEAKALTDPDLAAKVLDRQLMKEIQALRFKLNLAPRAEGQDDDDTSLGSVATDEDEASSEEADGA